jgi:hypothetical protein
MCWHARISEKEQVSSDKWIGAENNMKKKLTVLTLCAMLLPLSSSESAQQPKKVPRIGYLSPLDPAGECTRSGAIRLALRERGHVEGQNIAIEYRYAEGKLDRLPELAAELVGLKVDSIVAGMWDWCGPGAGRYRKVWRVSGIRQV